MAGEAERYLAPDERVVLQVRRHVAVLALPALKFLGTVALASVVGFMTSPDSGSDIIDLAVGLLAAYFSLRLGWAVWQWWVDRIIVTDQRVFEVSGVLTRKVASMPIGGVIDMTYRRTIMGRLLGYGDLVLESAGQDQALSSIEKLPKPDDFYRTVTGLVAARGSQPPEVAERVRGIFDDEDTGPLPRVIV